MKATKSSEKTREGRSASAPARAATTKLRSGSKGGRKKRTLAKTRRIVQEGSDEEQAMVERYIPLVKSVVSRVSINMPDHLDTGDLFSAGLTGLLQAIRQFDSKIGTTIETYARIRIRGAIFDELRRMDWVPRSIHTKARKIQAARQQLEQRFGRTATRQELAKALELTLVEYDRWKEETRPVNFVCLDAEVVLDNEDSLSHYDCMPDQRQENPSEGTYRNEVSGIISDCLKKLPEVQRKVLALYYFEDLRLAEIAEVYGLTESRICQIHAQGLQAIRQVLASSKACSDISVSF